LVYIVVYLFLLEIQNQQIFVKKIWLSIHRKYFKNHDNRFEEHLIYLFLFLFIIK